MRGKGRKRDLKKIREHSRVFKRKGMNSLSVLNSELQGELPKDPKEITRRKQRDAPL